MASRMAKKGKGSFGAKPPKSNSMSGNNYVVKAAGLKRGGIVGSSVPFGGPSAVKRLDRPGRKRGGAVGADSSPMTSAHSVSGGSGGDHDEDDAPGHFARGGPPRRRAPPPPPLESNMGGATAMPPGPPMSARPPMGKMRAKPRPKFSGMGPDLGE